MYIYYVLLKVLTMYVPLLFRYKALLQNVSKHCRLIHFITVMNYNRIKTMHLED